MKPTRMNKISGYILEGNREVSNNYIFAQYQELDNGEKK